MRHRIACFSAVFISVSVAVSAAEPAVVVVQPLLKVVSSAQRLRDVCTSDGEFDACTRFVAFRLNASCARSVERWSIEATATFRPWIFLYNLGSLRHEQLHIDDIRTYTERYIAELGREQFSSLETCDAAALAAAAGFEQKMREFAARSNAERHHAVPLQIAHRQ
jgi:hypothetical protein